MAVYRVFLCCVDALSVVVFLSVRITFFVCGGLEVFLFASFIVVSFGFCSCCVYSGFP